MARIAIIGAGMAGLSALSVLANAGHQVEVFEKSRGSGGRMASKRGQSASWDMGAQFLTATGSAFNNELQNWQQQGWIEPWMITPWVIDEQGQQPSPDERQRYVATPRMTALCRQLANQATALHTETRVISLQRQSGLWTLTADNGQSHEGFDAVIVSTPPAQALPLVSRSSSLRNACEQSTMLPCWTLLLAFEQASTIAFDAAFVKTGPIAWLARNNSKPGRDPQETWVIQANHAWSQSCIDHSRSWVEQQLLQAFWKNTGINPKKPVDSWLHRWLYAVPDTTADARTMLDGEQMLALCGDWLHSSNLEGAWLSGQQAGTELNQILQSRNGQKELS